MRHMSKPESLEPLNLGMLILALKKADQKLPCYLFANSLRLDPGGVGSYRNGKGRK